MPRLKFLASLLALSALLVPAFQGRAADRPNVIVVLADDLGFSDLSCYGGEIPPPNIDRLAACGAQCSAFYTSARCCPSRAALMTGLHPHQAQFPRSRRRPVGSGQIRQATGGHGAGTRHRHGRFLHH